MMTQINKIEKRIKEVLITDKKNTPINLNEVLKSDLYNVLKDYFVIEKQDILIKIDVENISSYGIKIAAKAGAVKALNYLK